jgi:hypothetical protein
VDGRFASSYGAAHAAALAALRWHGYRSENRFMVFQCLPHTLGWPAHRWRVLDAAHQKRNLAEYEGYLDIEESLVLEGARPGQILRKLTLPLLKPWISLALLFRLAQALGVFDLVQVLTRGGPAGSTESLALYAYLNAMRFLDFGYSATLVVATFLLLVLLTALGWLLLRRRPLEVS